MYGEDFAREFGETHAQKVFPPIKVSSWLSFFARVTPNSIKAAPDEFDVANGQEILSPEGKALDSKLIALYREG